MYPPILTREEFLELAHRKIHGMSAATKATLDAALRQEIASRKELQEKFDDLLRQVHTLSDLVREYEEMVPQLESQNREYEAKMKECREEIRRGKQREESNEEYTRRLELHCDEVKSSSSRAVVGATRREKDIRMELKAENLRAKNLEQMLHLADEKNRQIIRWLMQKLRAEYEENEALGQHTSELDQRHLRLERSQAQSSHRAHRIEKSSAKIIHQGQYHLAAESSDRKAKLQNRGRSSSKADSDILMTGYTDSAGRTDVDVIVMSKPPSPVMSRLTIQEILKRFLRGKKMKARRAARGNLGNDVQVQQISPLWVQYRSAPGECQTESSDAESSSPVSTPPRKKRAGGLDLEGKINQSPKRRRFSAEAPELRPRMGEMRIDEAIVTLTPQTGPQRAIRPRISRWALDQGAAGKKRQGPGPPKITPTRQIELPPQVSLLTAAVERQKLDARERSLSLNDLPQLPSGQTLWMRPSDTPGNDVVSQCQRAWRELLHWFVQLLWSQPSTVLVSVGVTVLAWVWHCHRVHEEWMAANEIPYSVASELRNARVSEIRWVEQLVFRFTEWMDTDRAMLG